MQSMGKKTRCQGTTSATEDRKIAATSKRNKLLTAPEIRSSIISSREDPISVTTVKRQLIKAEVGGRISTKKPLIWPQSKKKRLQ